MEEGDKLKKIKAKLEEENGHLKQEKEINDMMIQEKVQQARSHKSQIKEVTDVHYHSFITLILCSRVIIFYSTLEGEAVGSV